MKKIIITESQLNVLLKKRTKHLKNRLMNEEMDEMYQSQYDEDFLTPRAYMMNPEDEPSSDYETQDRKYTIKDTEFNQFYYPEHIGKTYSKEMYDEISKEGEQGDEVKGPDYEVEEMKMSQGGEPSSDYETAMKEKLGLNEPSSEEEMNIMKHGDTELEEYDDTISLDDFENMGSEISEYDSYLNEGQIKMKNVFNKYMKNPIIKGLSK